MKTKKQKKMKKIFALLMIMVSFALTGWSQPVINVFAGNGQTGNNMAANGVTAILANVNPVSVCTDTAHNVYYIDALSNSINEILYPSGVITVIAGAYNVGPYGTIHGYGGDGGSALNAVFNHPQGLCADDSGNVYVCDLANFRIRKIRKSTGIITTKAGTGVQGTTGNGGKAINATLGAPYSITCDLSGAHIYFVDQYANMVRLIQGDSVYQFAGSGVVGAPITGHGFDTTQFNLPAGICYSQDSGNVYVADRGNNCIQKLNKASAKVSVYAGNQTAGFTGDGGAATSAELNAPVSVSVYNDTGSVYIADQLNNRIRKVANSTRIITTAAGNGTQVNTGGGGLPTNAGLNTPFSVCLDPNTKYYFAVNGYYIMGATSH